MSIVKAHYITHCKHLHATWSFLIKLFNKTSPQQRIILNIECWRSSPNQRTELHWSEQQTAMIPTSRHLHQIASFQAFHVSFLPCYFINQTVTPQFFMIRLRFHCVRRRWFSFLETVHLWIWPHLQNLPPPSSKSSPHEHQYGLYLDFSDLKFLHTMAAALINPTAAHTYHTSLTITWTGET